MANTVEFCSVVRIICLWGQLNYTKHPMKRSVYHFHFYYHVRRILKKLQVPLPHKTGFNVADNPYTESDF